MCGPLHLGRKMMTHLHEETIDSEQVFKGVLLDVRRDRVRLPNGAESVREYVVHPGAVVIIPVLEDGRLIFENQYRYPLHRDFLELPAGKIDAGEEIAETARRELLEETGYVADEWRYLGVMHPCIGYSDERIEIFLAQCLRKVAEPALDHNEFLDVLSLSLDEAVQAIRDGRLTDAKTVTALFWAEKVLRGNW